MKKLLFTVLALLFFLSSMNTYSATSVFPYKSGSDWSSIWGSEDFKETVKEEISWDKSLINQLLDAFGIMNWQKRTASQYIKYVLDYFLAIVWFITLIVMIIWFYQMLTTSNFDEAYKKAQWYVVKAFWALLIMWFSWLIIDFMFRIYESTQVTG